MAARRSSTKDTDRPASSRLLSAKRTATATGLGGLGPLGEASDEEDDFFAQEDDYDDTFGEADAFGEAFVGDAAGAGIGIGGTSSDAARIGIGGGAG